MKVFSNLKNKRTLIRVGLVAYVIVLLFGILNTQVNTLKAAGDDYSTTVTHDEPANVNNTATFTSNVIKSAGGAKNNYVFTLDTGGVALFVSYQEKNALINGLGNTKSRNTGYSSYVTGYTVVRAFQDLGLKEPGIDATWLNVGKIYAEYGTYSLDTVKEETRMALLQDILDTDFKYGNTNKVNWLENNLHKCSLLNALAFRSAAIDTTRFNRSLVFIPRTLVDSNTISTSLNNRLKQYKGTTADTDQQSTKAGMAIGLPTLGVVDINSAVKDETHEAPLAASSNSNYGRSMPMFGTMTSSRTYNLSGYSTNNSAYNYIVEGAEPIIGFRNSLSTKYQEPISFSHNADTPSAFNKSVAKKVDASIYDWYKEVYDNSILTDEFVLSEYLIKYFRSFMPDGSYKPNGTVEYNRHNALLVFEAVFGGIQEEVIATVSGGMPPVMACENIKFDEMYRSWLHTPCDYISDPDQLAGFRQAQFMCALTGLLTQYAPAKLDRNLLDIATSNVEIVIGNIYTIDWLDADKEINKILDASSSKDPQSLYVKGSCFLTTRETLYNIYYNIGWYGGDIAKPLLLNDFTERAARNNSFSVSGSHSFLDGEGPSDKVSWGFKFDTKSQWYSTYHALGDLYYEVKDGEFYKVGFNHVFPDSLHENLAAGDLVITDEIRQAYMLTVYRRIMGYRYGWANDSSIHFLNHGIALNGGLGAEFYGVAGLPLFTGTSSASNFYIWGKSNELYHMDNVAAIPNSELTYITGTNKYTDLETLEYTTSILTQKLFGRTSEKGVSDDTILNGVGSAHAFAATSQYRSKVDVVIDMTDTPAKTTTKSYLHVANIGASNMRHASFKTYIPVKSYIGVNEGTDAATIKTASDAVTVANGTYFYLYNHCLYSPSGLKVQAVMGMEPTASAKNNYKDKFPLGENKITHKISSNQTEDFNLVFGLNFNDAAIEQFEQWLKKDSSNEIRIYAAVDAPINNSSKFTFAMLDESKKDSPVWKASQFNWLDTNSGKFLLMGRNFGSSTKSFANGKKPTASTISDILFANWQAGKEHTTGTNPNTGGTQLQAVIKSADISKIKKLYEDNKTSYESDDAYTIKLTKADGNALTLNMGTLLDVNGENRLDVSDSAKTLALDTIYSLGMELTIDFYDGKTKKDNFAYQEIQVNDTTKTKYGAVGLGLYHNMYAYNFGNGWITNTSTALPEGVNPYELGVDAEYGEGSENHMYIEISDSIEWGFTGHVKMTWIRESDGADVGQLIKPSGAIEHRASALITLNFDGTNVNKTLGDFYKEMKDLGVNYIAVAIGENYSKEATYTVNPFREDNVGKDDLVVPLKELQETNALRDGLGTILGGQKSSANDTRPSLNDYPENTSTGDDGHGGALVFTLQQFCSLLAGDSGSLMTTTALQNCTKTTAQLSIDNLYQSEQFEGMLKAAGVNPGTDKFNNDRIEFDFQAIVYGFGGVPTKYSGKTMKQAMTTVWPTAVSETLKQNTIHIAITDGVYYVFSRNSSNSDTLALPGITTQIKNQMNGTSSGSYFTGAPIDVAFVKYGKKAVAGACTYSNANAPGFASKIPIKLGDDGLEDEEMEAYLLVTSSVAPEVIPEPDWCIVRTNSPIAYAQVKNGAWSDSAACSQTWNVLTGIPSTDTFYITSGGSEFILEMAVEETLQEQAYRSYSSYFANVDCKFKLGDVAQAGGGGSNASPSGNEYTYTAKNLINHEYNNDNVEKSVKDQFKIPIPQDADGAGTCYQVTQHGGQFIQATWTGTIANKTTDPGIDKYTDVTDNISSNGTYDLGHPGQMTTNGVNSQDKEGGNYIWDVTEYNKELEYAYNWAKSCELGSNVDGKTDGNIVTYSDSDRTTRTFHLGDAVISITINGIANFPGINEKDTIAYKSDGTFNTTCTTDTTSWADWKLVGTGDKRLASGYAEKHGEVHLTTEACHSEFNGYTDDITGTTCNDTPNHTGNWNGEQGTGSLGQFVPENKSKQLVTLGTMTEDHSADCGSDHSATLTGVSSTTVNYKTYWCEHDEAAKLADAKQPEFGGCGCNETTDEFNVVTGHSPNCSSASSGTAEVTALIPHTCTASHEITKTKSETVKSPDYTYKINVQFKNTWAMGQDGTKVDLPNSTYSKHCLCGPCCEHKLPDISDNWVQYFAYSTVRITDIRVNKISRSYVQGINYVTLDYKNAVAGHSGTDYLEGHITQGDASIFCNIALQNPTYYDSVINNRTWFKYDNIMVNGYNIRGKTTGIVDGAALSGRLRHSLQSQQHDAVIWYEVNKGAQHRTTDCDGMATTTNGNMIYTALNTKAATGSYNPAPTNGTGHNIKAKSGDYVAKSWSLGMMYYRSMTNQNAGRDVWYNHNPELYNGTFTHIVNWLDYNGGPTKVHVQKYSTPSLKSNYSNSMVDDVDIKTVEWARFVARRQLQNDVYLNSDILIFQGTNEGDQAILNETRVAQGYTVEMDIGGIGKYNDTDEDCDGFVTGPLTMSLKNIFPSAYSDDGKIPLRDQGLGKSAGRDYTKDTQQNSSNKKIAYTYTPHGTNNNMPTYMYAGQGVDTKIGYHVLIKVNSDAPLVVGYRGHGESTLNNQAILGGTRVSTTLDSNGSALDATINHGGAEAAIAVNTAGTINVEATGQANVPNALAYADAVPVNDLVETTTDSNIFKSSTAKMQKRYRPDKPIRIGQLDIQIDPTTKNEFHDTIIAKQFWFQILSYTEEDHKGYTQADFDGWKTNHKVAYRNILKEYYKPNQTHALTGATPVWIQEAYYYGQSTTGKLDASKKVNGILIHTPASSTNTYLADSTPFYDQRTTIPIRGELTTNKCPGTAALCEFSTLDCRYTQDQVVFNTQFDKQFTYVSPTGVSEIMNGIRSDTSGYVAAITDMVNSLTVSFRSGYATEISNGYGSGVAMTGQCFEIPLETLGAHHQTGTKIVVTLNGAFTSGYKIFESGNVYASVNGNTIILTNGKATRIFSVSAPYNYHSLEFTIDYNNIMGCTLKVNGTAAGYTDYNSELGYTYAEDYTAGLKVGERCQLYGVQIKRLAGKLEHDEGCYSSIKICETVQNYLCDNVTTLSGTGQKSFIAPQSGTYLLELFNGTEYVTKKVFLTKGETIYAYLGSQAYWSKSSTDEAKIASYSTPGSSGTKTFGVAGAVTQTWTAPATGDYVFKVYGAGGGADADKSGQAGGYITGTMHLPAGTIVNVQVGYAGASNASGSGGGWGCHHGYDAGQEGSSGAGGGSTAVWISNGMGMQARGGNGGSLENETGYGGDYDGGGYGGGSTTYDGSVTGVSTGSAGNPGGNGSVSITYNIPGVDLYEYEWSADSSKILVTTFGSQTQYDFGYTGMGQGITLAPGTYTLQAWGARGGGAARTAGSHYGQGGYTQAVTTLTSPLKIYTYVGQAGAYGSGTSSFGGPAATFNGGGAGGNLGSGSGGGATDFRLTAGLWSDLNSLKSRILVAGGGGGADDSTTEAIGTSNDGSGGNGGGLTAEGAYIDGVCNAAYAGTQTTGNAFGIGASVTTNTDTGGAGGGWYGGLATNNNNGGGGGGSSYIKGHAGCSTAYLSNQGSITLTNGYIQLGGHDGGGYARIILNSTPTTANQYTSITRTYISSTGCPSSAPYYWFTSGAGSTAQIRLCDHTHTDECAIDNSEYNSHSHALACIDKASPTYRYMLSLAVNNNTAGLSAAVEKYLGTTLASLGGTCSSAYTKLNSMTIDITKIPSEIDGADNPILACLNHNNTHVHTLNCESTIDELVCDNVHHEGQHYKSGSIACYKPCLNDTLHGKHENEVDGVIYSDLAGMNLDNYFDVYWDNYGNFIERPDKIVSVVPEQVRGQSYVQGMDTTRWLKRKIIVFRDIDVLFYNETTGKWTLHKAGEKIYLPITTDGIVGNGDDDVLHRNWRDANQNAITVYHFYCLLDNHEYHDTEYTAWTEALNSSSSFGQANEPYKKLKDEVLENDAVDTNKDRFDINSNFYSRHSTKQIYSFDVVGQIGNYIITYTTDYRWTNFFKKADTSGWLTDNILYKIYDDQQARYLNIGREYANIDVKNHVTAQSTGWFDTWATEEWKKTSIPMNKIVASDTLAAETTYAWSKLANDLKCGYDIFCEVTTTGDYNKVSVNYSYYIMDKLTGEVKPVDLWSSIAGSRQAYYLTDENADRIYEVMLAGTLAGNYGITNVDSLALYYLYNDLNVQKKLRMLPDDQIAMANLINKEYFSHNVYDTAEDGTESLRYVEGKGPTLDRYQIGTAYGIVVDQQARTYIGSDYNNLGLKWNGGYYTNFGTAIEPKLFTKQARRWLFTAGVAENTVAVMYDGVTHTDLTIDVNSDKIIKDYERYALLVGCDTFSYGDVWDLEYEAFEQKQTVLGKKLPTSIPDIIAVYDLNSKEDDFDIQQSH